MSVMRRRCAVSKPRWEAYLETHHIVWVSQGGSDTMDNTVALCPNCHRKMHVLNLKEDKEYLKAVIEREKSD